MENILEHAVVLQYKYFMSNGSHSNCVLLTPDQDVGRRFLPPPPTTTATTTLSSMGFALTVFFCCCCF
jgi:hypothetical protein